MWRIKPEPSWFFGPGPADKFIWEAPQRLAQVHSPSRSDRYNASSAAHAIKTRCAQAPRHATLQRSTVRYLLVTKKV